MTNIESVDPSAGVAVCQVNPWDWEGNQFLKEPISGWYMNEYIVLCSGRGGPWNTGLCLGRSGDDGPTWPGCQGADVQPETNNEYVAEYVAEDIINYIIQYVAEDELMFPG